MKKCTFKNPYNRSEESIRDCNIVEFTEPSKVKESLAYATDIHTIYEQYCNSGKVPLNGQQPIYDENFVNYDSLIEAYDIIGQASDYFSKMPADIRSHYGNNLENFVKSIHSNDQFLIDKGVLKLPEKKEVPSDVPVMPSVGPASPEQPLVPSVEKQPISAPEITA